MNQQNHNSFSAAIAVLGVGAPDAKVAAAKAAAEAWRRGALQVRVDALAAPPARPARPGRPILVAPGDVRRRRLGSPAGHVALLHAVAHIEFNAIDLAFDMAARFAPAIAAAGLDVAAFIGDWFAIGADETRHFCLIRRRLKTLGADYGDLPAHDGLWEAAEATADDVLARLAVAPMALEARGLDVTPGMIERLAAAGDGESAAALGVIYREEIGHVGAGARWFEAVCAARRLAPQPTFRRLVETRFKSALKPPFNHDARARAGLARTYYAFDDSPATTNPTARG